MTSSGALNTRQTYYPYGAKRVFDGSALPTDYTFTGQKSDDSTGLMFYNARYYDATLGRFTQADSIVPDPLDPQSWNRYAYVNNNPVRYVDPTGHMLDEPDDTGGDNNGGGGYVDNRPYCEKFPYASGCFPLPATNDGGPDQNSGESCWPRCNRDDEADAQAQAASYPQEPPTAKCLGHCFPPASGPDPTRADKPAGYGGLPSTHGKYGNSTGTCNVQALIWGCAGVWKNYPTQTVQKVRLKLGDVVAQRVYIGSDPSKVAVIGRNMRDRVIPFARRIGAETWNGFNGKLSTAENVANNRAWAEGLKREGYTIYDVGLDPKYAGGGNFNADVYYQAEIDIIFGGILP